MPNREGLITPDAVAAMFDAVRTVAEQSFFSVAEAADPASLQDLGPDTPEWLVATVHFEQHQLLGAVSCTLPQRLANGLFDAFTGRDPSEPAPSRAMVHDLVGEFSNMVCGAWLTRIAKNQTFTLNAPMVTRAPAPGLAGDLRMLAVINDLPVALDLRLLRA